MKKNILNAFVSISMLTIISKLFGFLKSSYIAYVFGSGQSTDIFYTVNGFISDMFYVLSTSLAVAFLPIYIKVREDGLNNKYFASRVLLCFGAISLILFGCVQIFAEPITYGLSNGGKLDQRIVYIFLKILSTGLLMSLLINLLQCISDAEHKYHYGPIGNICNNFTFFLCVLILHKRIGIYALPLAAISSLIMQIIVLYSKSRRHLEWKGEYSKYKQYLQLLFLNALPILLSNTTIELNQLIDRQILVSIGNGAVSAISYAAVLFQFASHIINLPLTTIVYTELSEIQAKQSEKEVSNFIIASLRLSVLISVPVLLVILVYSENIVSIAYGRGAFDYNAIVMVSSALGWYSYCLITYSLRNLLVRAYYSIGNTKIPMRLGIVEMLINIILSITLSKYFGMKGVVCATVFASATVTLLLFILAYRMNLVKEIRMFLLFMCKCMGVMIIAYVLLKGIECVLSVKYAILDLIVGTSIAFFIYTCLLMIFKIEEYEKMLQLIKARVRIWKKRK